MKRIVQVALLALLCLMVCVPGQAATKLRGYTLIVDGKEVELNLKTGYLYRSGNTLMVPVEALCDAMMLKCTLTNNANALIQDAEGNQVSLRYGVKKVQVNGKVQTLRTKVARQDGQILTADVKLLGYLGAKYKQYTPAAARKLGYNSGALVVDTTGNGTQLPDITPAADELPQQALEAAKTTSQLITVEYNAKQGNAQLTFYQKDKTGWHKQFASVNAYVGKNGIGKTQEGDGKTPSGVYGLSQPFGILQSPGTSVGKYVQVTKYHYWCDDPSSRYYNQLVDTRTATDFKASQGEHLKSVSPEYNYGIFIEYNKEGEGRKGSAIFLHCKGNSKTTSGCIAVEQSVMKALLRQLKPGAKIVIY